MNDRVVIHLDSEDVADVRLNGKRTSHVTCSRMSHANGRSIDV